MVQGHSYALTPCRIYPEVEKLFFFATFGIHLKKSQVFLQVHKKKKCVSGRHIFLITEK